MTDDVHRTGNAPGTAVTLAQIPQQIWNLLGTAVGETGHPFRTPVLATSDKPAPATRIVILRNVDSEQQHLECYTDYRSAKIRQLSAIDSMSWNFYDDKRKLQVRAWGSAEILKDNDYTRQCWRQLKEYQKKPYAQALAPGEPLEAHSPDPPPLVMGDMEAGQDNFVVVRSCIHEFEWLQLAREGHRRAGVMYVNGHWSSQWLIP